MCISFTVKLMMLSLNVDFCGCNKRYSGAFVKSAYFKISSFCLLFLFIIFSIPDTIRWIFNEVRAAFLSMFLPARSLNFIRSPTPIRRPAFAGGGQFPSAIELQKILFKTENYYRFRSRSQQRNMLNKTLKACLHFAFT